jgi:uncharacterized protein YggL (DUF469 family)
MSWNRNWRKYDDQWEVIPSRRNKHVTPVQNNKSKFNVAIKIKQEIIEQLKKYPDIHSYDNIKKLVQIFEKYILTELKNEEEQSICISTMMGWCLWKVIYTSTKLMQLTKKIHEYGKYKLIHYALFPRYNGSFKVDQFTANDQDAIETVTFLIDNFGYNALDMNQKDESALQSLKVAYDENKFSKDAYQAIYHYMTQPKDITPMVTQILNKLTETSKTKFTTPYLWLLHLDKSSDSVIGKKMFYEFTGYKKTSKNSARLYTIILDKIHLFKSMIENGPDHSTEFRNYFKDNPWNGEEMKMKFYSILKNTFLDISLNNYTDENKWNLETIGACVGFMANVYYKDVISFCDTYIKEYPLVVLTCINHAHSIGVHNKFINYVEDLSHHADGRIRFFAKDFLDILAKTEIVIQEESKEDNIYGNTYFNKINIPSHKLNNDELDDLVYTLELLFHESTKRNEHDKFILGLLCKSIELCHNEIMKDTIEYMINYLTSNGYILQEDIHCIKKEHHNIINDFCTDNCTWGTVVFKLF